MTRKDSIKELKDILFKRRDALKNALAGDLSQLRELQASGDIVDLALDEAFRRALTKDDAREWDFSAKQISRTRTRTREAIITRFIVFNHPIFEENREKIIEISSTEDACMFAPCDSCCDEALIF